MSHITFLKSLLEAAGPTGYEERAASVWLAEAATFADQTYKDRYGNSFAVLNPDAKTTIMLSGHIDEIGVIVTHVDSDGLIYFQGLGGWDPQVLVGQRIRLMAEEGDILAVVGKKAIHLMDSDERSKASKIDDLWLDAALPAEEVKTRVKVGTAGRIEQPVLFSGRKIISPALDNRIGAYVVLEALKRMKELGFKERVVAVASSQEEIGAWGARVAAHSLNPDLALTVDLCFESKAPGINVKKLGESEFGSGTAITVGPFIHPAVAKGLQDAATQHKLKYTLNAAKNHTATDADEIHLIRSGVPGAVLSIPSRYMHSPNEIVDLDDVDNTIELMAQYVLGIQDYRFIR
ncbi:M20/M25/M40 family metallo-hydrolase [Deinococcus cellulosilyticus]|uniref:Endoglucanase n=1 Tax=Deinococcus cellulosilyticus (strain DSM 18568 / NBRC 106333 / KACC 11606 / 5516J-15) TaxID=1223518 RepID=A0A511N3H2_DEIC1|nr:M20/M25/M40 family metallo-hydrolase [Deinococcus cellulosilyticus]GEM47037.1 endoglucanase [Deinococcus cellulosilyticus NBRC 106333 = KACC 11606]